MLFCLTSPVVGSLFGAGMRNQPGTLNRLTKGNYGGYEFGVHYGSHDWVFDYAIQLIEIKKF